MELKQVVQWMLENGYLVAVKGKYKVTAKFNKEMTGQETGLIVVNGKPLVMEVSPPVLNATPDWRQLYMNFILEAQVPSKAEGRDGVYDLNKYSEPAMREFKKMIEKEKIQYPILVKSTMLYYKTRKRYQVTVSRYITEGLWRSDYEALLSSAESGTVEQHIKQEINDNTEFTKFKLG